MSGYAAIVLAGGAGRRLGGPAKPTLTVGGWSMVARVLAAVSDAVPRVVVGPPTLAGMLPAGAQLTCEQPPGGGPVAATAAGLGLLPKGTEYAALLAADLPFLTGEAIAALHDAASTVDGALFVDATGRQQLLCGLWRVDSLRARLRLQPEVAGRSMRDLVDGLRVAEVSWAEPGPPPWYDCDTETDLRRAEELI
jgi:molybdopterin-guanine dinucleotide biosynthesis protein A